MAHQVNVISNIWELLSQDVAFLGGPSSPVLSWLGSLGILFFVFWQGFKFKREVLAVRCAFDRVCPILSTAVTQREDIVFDEFSQHRRKDSPSHPAQASVRTDQDDLYTLDADMKKEPLFREPWTHYRKTLVAEQVPWFMEPRIFSTRSARDIFTGETLFTNRINLAFYHQVPSLVTGFGLLLTFLALFIGLGKLHAEGSDILGIQGLINGLAGKFLTSIVGLIAGLLFSLLEKTWLSYLTKAHHNFLGLIDQLFPRKTMEHMLEQLTGMPPGWKHHQPKIDPASHSSSHRVEPGCLGGPTADLSRLVQTLTKLKEEERGTRHLVASELSQIFTEQFQAPLQELTDTLHSLATYLKNSQTIRSAEVPAKRGRPFLWQDSSNVPTSSRVSHTNRDTVSVHRRTG